MISKNRRLWAVLGGLVVLGLLVSCAPAAAPPTSPPATAPPKAETSPVKPSGSPAAPSPTPKPAAEAPRYGGLLSSAMTADMPSFDVHQEAALLTHATVLSAYNGLVQYQPSQPDKIIADLAESWDVSPDGTVYTFRLHKGVKFHDGSAVTAEDAKFSLERIYDPPRNILSPRKSTLAAIKELKPLDQDTLQITLKFAQGSFLPMLAVGQVAVYPRKVVEAKGDMKKDIVGSGPFMFKEYALGSLFEVKKNPNYFIKGRPYLDGLRFYVVRDESTRLAAFRTGQVRLIDPTWPQGLRPAHVQIVRKEMPQAVIAQYPSLASRWLNMVVTTPPLDDVRVRRAVSLAVDRQAAIKVLEDGEADIGTNFVAGSDWAMPEAELVKLPGYRQPKDADIAEAKRLLSEAGFDRGFKTRILARAKYTEDMAVLMKEQLARIGIELELVVQESSIFLDQILKLGHPMVAQPTTLRMSDPDELSVNFTSGGGSNRNGIKNRDIDALFDRQGRALDPAERKKIVRGLEAKLLELTPAVVLFWQRGNIAYWPDIKNYYRGSIYHTNKFQDVWLAR